MAIPGSGPVSLGDIQTEFGGISPTAISEYYAGGVYVPPGTGNIPSSGQISISDFYGAAAEVTITSLFQNVTSWAGDTYDIDYQNPENLLAKDGNDCIWNWNDVGQDGRTVRFFNPVTPLPGNAVILNMKVEYEIGVAGTNDRAEVFPRGYIVGISKTQVSDSAGVYSFEGDPAYWGATSAQLRDAYNSTSNSTSAEAIGVRMYNNTSTSFAGMDWVEVTITYVT